MRADAPASLEAWLPPDEGQARLRRESLQFLVEHDDALPGVEEALKALKAMGKSGISPSNRDRIQSARFNERRGIGRSCKGEPEGPRLS